MQAYEIVEREVERKGVKMVLDLLGKGVGQPSETPHSHAHRKVRPLDVRRADMFALRMARHARLAASHTLGRAVASDRVLGAGTIDFDEHSLVDVAAENRANRHQDRPGGQR